MKSWTKREDATLKKLWLDGKTEFHDILATFPECSRREIESRARLLELTYGYLKIKDRRWKKWDVIQGSFSMFIEKSGQLMWNFDIETDEKEFDDNIWQPRVYIENYPIAMAERIPFPAGILNKKLEISRGSEHSDHLLPGGHNACLYVFEHEWLDQVKITLLGRRGPLFDMDLTAKCALGWHEDSINLDMRIIAPICFQGIWLQERDESKARRILEKHFEQDQMRFILGEDGKHGAFIIPPVP